MAWGEAVRLAGLLRRDPSSWICAALEEWEYPLARTDLILMDHFDLTHQGLGPKRFKPYPRPFRVAAEEQRRGKAISRSEAVAILNRFGHDIPV